MAFKHVIEIVDLLDRATIEEAEVRGYFQKKGLEAAELETREVRGEHGGTLFVRITIPGVEGKLAGKKAPTLGIIGRLGGIGARPHRIGLVSDADGAISALACAAKLAEMRSRGDRLDEDIVVATHLCPRSPIIPHDPVPFMGAPVSMEVMNRYEVSSRMEAILSIDTTKGNRVVNTRGFAISPTVKDGYILRVSEDLLELMQVVTGRPPVVFPVTIQDITPYGNGLYHLNSILQPATATSAPVVGVAITAEVAVPGCATGTGQAIDLEGAVRFCLEVAKSYGRGECSFFDEGEFRKLVALYGSLERLKTPGKTG